MARLGYEEAVTVVAADGAEWTPPQEVDAVLLDAPCTATGTIRRHPDVLHLKQPKDLENMCRAQARLLSHAAAFVRPGGVLVYCTCSLQKEEGEYQIAAFLNENKPYQRLPVDRSALQGLEAVVDQNGDIRSLPFYLAPHGGMDGFFISRLQRG